MSTTLKKSLLIGLGIFVVIMIAIGVVYIVRRPAPVASPPPTPRPTATPIASPVTPPVFVVDPVNSSCTNTFVVACGSATPSASPSSTASATPSAPVYPSPSPSTPPSAALDCVVKRMYSDDSRNRAGFYYIEQEIIDTNTLQSGQTIVYNIVAKNTGGNSVPDTTITDNLSNNLTYVDGDSGCIYDSVTRVVTCTVGSLSAGSEVQRSFRAKVAASGAVSVANTAEVASTNGQRDSCSVVIDATGKVVTTVPSPVPTSLPVAGVFEVTVGTVGVGLLLLILGGLGLLLI